MEPLLQLLLRASSNETPDLPGVRAVEALLSSAHTHADTHTHTPVHPGSYVRVAEAALEYEQYDLAASCVDAFLAGSPPKTQFYVRAQYVKACVSAQKARLAHGAAALRILADAVSAVLYGMAIAEDAYRASQSVADASMVYNGTVRHWEIVRVYVRPGSRHVFAASFQRVCEALASIDDPDARWRIRNHVAAAVCLTDAKDYEGAKAQLAASQTLCAGLPVADFAADADMAESVARLRAHVQTVADMSSGGALSDSGSTGASKPPSKGTSSSVPGKATGASVIDLAPSAPTQPISDVRMQVWTVLQPVLSATTPGLGLDGGALTFGATDAAVDIANVCGSGGSPAPRGKDGVRTRILDALRMLRPAAVAQYNKARNEAASGVLDFSKEMPGAASASPASASPRAPGADSIASAATSSTFDAATIDLLAFVAQAAAQNGFWDIVSVCLNQLRAEKGTSPTLQVVSDVATAILSASCLSVEDAYESLGHLQPVPSDVVDALMLAHGGPATGDQSFAGARMRRMTMALALQSSMAPRRSTMGRVLMLPGGAHFSTTELPSLTPEAVSKLQHARRVSALKDIKSGLFTAQRARDPFLVEFSASAAWNLALPLLSSTGRDRAVVQPIFDLAALALEEVQSTYVQLRVRVHLELARMHAAADMVTSALAHVDKALALDYGSLRSGPAVPPASVPGAAHYISRYSAQLEEDSSTLRPFDRFLWQLGRGLAVKAAVYDEPTSPTEQVTLLVEQAKSARDAKVAASLLEKASVILCKLSEGIQQAPSVHYNHSDRALLADASAPTRDDVAGGARRVRALSYAQVISDANALVLSRAGTDASEDGARGAGTAAKSSSRPGSSHSTSRGKRTGESDDGAQNMVTGKRVVPAYPAAAALSTTARNVHALWSDLASVAARHHLDDLVLQAGHVVRSALWDPLCDRDMVVRQARLDLFVSEVAMRRAAAFPLSTAADEHAAARIALARAQQRERHAAAEQAYGGQASSSGQGSAAGSPRAGTAVTKPSASTAASQRDEERKKAEDEIHPSGGNEASVLGRALRSPWWDDDAVAAASGDTFDGDAGDAPDEMLETEGDDLSRAPQQAICKEMGSWPTQKPIPDDVRALGLIVPGCPIQLFRWKVRAISALSRAARRAAACGCFGLVTIAARRLWNAHLHVWQANEYGLEVMPILAHAIIDALHSLATLPRPDGELVGRLVYAASRFHEERARIAQVDAVVGAVAGVHPYFSCAGAVLLDLDPRSAGVAGVSEDALHQDAILALDGPAWDAPLLAALSTPLRGQREHLEAALQLVSGALALPMHVLSAPSRRDLWAARGRLKLAKAFPLVWPTSDGTVTEPSHPAPAIDSSAIAKKGAAVTALPTSVSDVLASVDEAEADAGASAGASAAQMPTTAKCVGLLQAVSYDAVPLVLKVPALRAALESLDALSAELTAALDSVGVMEAKAGSSGGKAEGGKPAKSSGTTKATAGAKLPPGASTGTCDSWAPSCRISWGQPDPTAAAVCWPVDEREILAATGMGSPAASTAAERATLHRRTVALQVELWSRIAAGALSLAAASPSGADTGLVVDAQKAAATALALAPAHAMRRQEMGHLLGVRGSGSSDTSVPRSPPKPAETVAFSTRFDTSLRFGSVDGSGHGGYSNAFKWWCVAELVWGCAVVMLVMPSKQSRNDQDTMRLTALRHVAAGASWALGVKDAPLIRSCAMLCFNLARALTQSPAMQVALAAPTRDVLRCLRECGEVSRDGLLLASELYRIVLQSYVAEQDWHAGMQVAEEAFQFLPVAYQEKLWSIRLVFQSKLGMDVTLALANMRESDPHLRAALWLSLSRTSATARDQSSAYQHAIETLEGTFSQAYALADYGEWLLARGAPVADVRDALHAAADIVLQVVQRDASEEDEAGDEGSTVLSGNKRGDGRAGSVGSGRAGSVGGGSRAMPATGRVQGSTPGSVGKAGRALTVATQGPARGSSSKASSVGSAMSGLGAQPGVVSDWPDHVDVSHVDLLLRIMALLAQVAHTGKERTQYLLMFAVYAQEAWRIAIRTANLASAERAYFQLSDADRAGISSYDAWLSERVAAGPYQLVPNADAWASFWTAALLEPSVANLFNVQSSRDSPKLMGAPALHRSGAAEASTSRPTAAPPVAKPDIADASMGTAGSGHGTLSAASYASVRRAFNALPGAHATSAISKAAFRNAAASWTCLSWAATALLSAGLAVQCAPVLALWHTISADVLSPNVRAPFVAACLTVSARWADALSIRTALASCDRSLNAAGVLRLPRGEASALSVEVDMLEQRARFAQVDETTHARGQKNALALVRHPRVHDAWLQLARYAADTGRTHGARELVREIYRHARVLNDHSCAPMVAALAARSELAEGGYAAAVRACLSMLRARDTALSPADMHYLISTAVSALTACHRYADAESLVAGAVESICGCTSAHDSAGNVDLELAIAEVRLRLLAAHLSGGLAARAQRSGKMWWPAWSKAVSQYEAVLGLCEKFDLNDIGGWTAKALFQQANQMIAIPGADVFRMPSIDTDFVEDTDVEERLRARTECSNPAHQARIATLASSASTMLRALQSARKWHATCSASGSHVSNSTHPSAKLECTIAAAVVCAFHVLEDEDVAAARATERILRARFGDDAVALYMHTTADRQFADIAAVTEGIAHRATEAAACAAELQPWSSVTRAVAMSLHVRAALDASLARAAVADDLWGAALPSSVPAGDGALDGGPAALQEAVSGKTKGGATSAKAPAGKTSSGGAPAGARGKASDGGPGGSGTMQLDGTKDVVPLHDELLDASSIMELAVCNLAEVGDEHGLVAASRQPATDAIVAPSLLAASRLQLVQAVRAACGAGNAHLGALACELLAENQGTRTPARTALLLAQAQAFRASTELRRVYTSAVSPSSALQLHGRLLEGMETEFDNADELVTAASAKAFGASRFFGQRFMSCSRPLHLVCSMLEPGSRVVVLHTSTSGRIMYGAVLARTGAVRAPPASAPQPAGPSPRAAPSAAPPLFSARAASSDPFIPAFPEASIPGLACAVTRWEMDEEQRAELCKLCNEFREFRTASGPLVRIFSDDNGAAGDLRDFERSGGARGHRHSSVASKMDLAEVKLLQLISRMNVLFKQLFDRDVVASAPDEAFRTFGSWCSASAGPVILCCDRALSVLPLEACAPFSRCTTLARDFSIQTYGHRLAVSAWLRRQTSSAATATATEPSASLEDWHMASPAPAALALAERVTIVVDPKNEDRPEKRGLLQVLLDAQYREDQTDAGGAAQPAAASAKAKRGPEAPQLLGQGATVSTRSALLKAMGKPLSLLDPTTSTAIASGWNALAGTSAIVSEAAWQSALRRVSAHANPSGDNCVGGGFCYLGHGSIFHYLPPASLVGLHTPSIRAAILLDMTSNDASVRTQADCENALRSVEGQLELLEPWETAAILSFCGVGTVLLNRWAASVFANEALLHGAVNSAVQGTPLTAACRSLWYPVVEAADAAAGENKSALSGVDPDGPPRPLVKERVRLNQVAYGIPGVRLALA